MILRSLHNKHPGRDRTLATISNVWWPRLHREVVGIINNCSQCPSAGISVKLLLRQNQIGKVPQCVENNQEVAIDFAGQFQNSAETKNCLLVLIDSLTDGQRQVFKEIKQSKK